MALDFFFGPCDDCGDNVLTGSSTYVVILITAILREEGAKREIGVVEKLRGMERLKDPVMVLKAGDLN